MPFDLPPVLFRGEENSASLWQQSLMFKKRRRFVIPFPARREHLQTGPDFTAFLPEKREKSVSLIKQTHAIAAWTRRRAKSAPGIKPEHKQDAEFSEFGEKPLNQIPVIVLNLRMTEAQYTPLVAAAVTQHL